MAANAVNVSRALREAGLNPGDGTREGIQVVRTLEGAIVRIHIDLPQARRRMADSVVEALQDRGYVAETTLEDERVYVTRPAPTDA